MAITHAILRGTLPASGLPAGFLPDLYIYMSTETAEHLSLQYETDPYKCTELAQEMLVTPLVTQYLKTRCIPDDYTNSHI